MIRSKLSIRVVLLVAGVGLSVAALAGSQPAAASGGHCKFSHRFDPAWGSVRVIGGGFYHRHGFYHGPGHGGGGGHCKSAVRVNGKQVSVSSSQHGWSGDRRPEADLSQ